MPDNVNSTTFAGLDGIYASFLDSRGLMSGFANISAPAASSGLRKLQAAQTLPSALPEPVRKIIDGDNRAYDQFPFASSTLPGGDIVMGTNDLALDAAAQNSLVWALGAWNLGIYGQSNPTFSNMMILAHQDAHSQDAGSKGQVGYDNILYPNCQLLPTGEESPNWQTEGKNRYSASFLPFSTFPMGQLLDNTNFAVTDGIKVKWFSTHRTFFIARVADGTITSVVLDYTPVDAAHTKVGLMTTGGVFSLATITSVTPSTKTVLLSAAPASGTWIVVMYEALRLS